MKRLLVALLLGFILLGAASHSTQAQSADAILQQVNQFRLNNGLAPLKFNGALASAAQNQANYMAEYNVFSNHNGYGGSTPQSRANSAGYNGRVSENIVGGTNLTAPRGLTWWVNSPVHYRTLITSQYTEAGAGYSSAGDINYFVLVVGQPSDAPIQPPSVSNDPAPLFITPITLAEAKEDGSIIHIVLDGQALWSLAAHYDVPLSDLLLYNHLEADSFLQTGDEIIIRLADGAPIPPTPLPPTSHLVRSGDTLWTIAANYDVRIGDVFWFNNLTEDSFLQPGQEIKIRLLPGEAPPPTATPITNHVVQGGETLWQIALSYGLSLEEIVAFNNIEQDAFLHPGDELRVVSLPEATATPLPVSTPTPLLPTPTVTVTPTSMSFPLASPAAVAEARVNVNNENTAVSNSTPSEDSQSSSLASPWLVGSIIFAIGLTTLGGAFILAVRKEKL